MTMNVETTKMAVELLTGFFNVVSDGYNPALIYFNYSENSLNIEKETFVQPSHYGNDPENRYYYNIIETETIIEDVRERIIQNFQWSTEHLILFSKTPTLFESKFHLDNFKTLVSKVENQVLELIKTWDLKTSEYLIDSKDGSLRRVLIIKSEDKSIILDFGNYIH
ncbi:hypothetical protein K5V07_14535 [Flavobacterium sp. CHNK8]|uniref:hypothetical protein n=1 Tax=Flavobacterium sp. CHNK8 TaxID=2871165 RepID=UPI001C8D5090|nr:hypothetical protein [Flavobacterium sp. CHNK8]QZK91650.1 hypothetical protein K5V07_14535 [Flavobacterium sp. CHNK8]